MLNADHIIKSHPNDRCWDVEMHKTVFAISIRTLAWVSRFNFVHGSSCAHCLNIHCSSRSNSNLLLGECVQALAVNIHSFNLDECTYKTP
jgi:hypothetical protein